MQMNDRRAPAMNNNLFLNPFEHRVSSPARIVTKVVIKR